MEKYIEVAVPRKNSLKDHAVCFVSCMLPILLGTYLVMMIYSATNRNFMFVGLSCFVCAILYYVAYKIFCRFTVDWEYTLVDDEIRFAKIINKSKRRELVTVPLSKIQVVARVDDTLHIHELNKTFEKKLSYISQTNKNYFFISGYDKDGKSVCIFFEPDDRMCENFRVTLRGKFFG